MWIYVQDAGGRHVAKVQADDLETALATLRGSHRRAHAEVVQRGVDDHFAIVRVNLIWTGFDFVGL